MTILDKIFAFIAGCLIVFTATVTLLDYLHKGKHIDRKKW